MTIRIGEAVMLLIIPVILSIMLVFFKTLPDRLIAWYCAGLLMSQWLHVMLFISFDKINNPNKTTVLKIAYFFEKKWWVIFVLGVAVCTFTAIGLYIITKGGNDIHIKHITLMVLLSVFLSQLCGSSIPKFGGELAMGAFFIVGILIDQYFLTYAPNSNPPNYQIQSDALTSIGLIVAFVSLWWPCAVEFGNFLFKSYFSSDKTLVQFQMTRYGAYIAWMLIGIGLPAWRSLEILVISRKGSI